MKKILVVDDSQVVRSFHMNIIKMEGFATAGANDGIEAMEKTLKEDFDLILCDINMPNMDGLTFIEQFRQETGKNTPIIILTTQEKEVHRKKGFAAGANLYLVKPVKPNNLVLHMKLLLGVAHEKK